MSLLISHLKIRVLFFFLFFSITSCFGKSYFVAPKGNNHSVGSFSHPFKTIQFAINQLKPGDQCFIRKGTYFENLKFNHSGTKEKQIVVQNYNNEKVVIKPHRFKNKWKKWKGEIYRTRINDSVIQLFSGNKSLMQASFPNVQEGNMNTSHWMSTIAYPSKDIILKTDKKLNFVSAHFIGMSKHGLIALNGDVISQEKNKVLLKNNGFYWQKRFTNNYLGEGKGFFVGKLVFLDTPGEWFSDGDFLYYWPKNKDLKKDDLTFRTVKNTIILDDQSYIQFSGIELVGGCISLQNSTHCKVNKVKITYPVPFFSFASGFSRYSPNRGESSEVFEGLGIHISGSYNTIEKCNISKSWGDGVFIDGHHNRISNCRVEDCDWMGIDCSPLFIGGKNQLVDHCDFSKAGRSVLIHSGIKSSKIIYNKIHNGGILCKDLGLTYCYQSDGENTEIAYNWVYENHASVNGAGIYLDNGNSNFDVHHNVVWGCLSAMMINQPTKNAQVKNNTFWNNKYTMCTFHPTPGKTEIVNVVCSKNITDSELRTVLHRPFVASKIIGNQIVENIFEVLENPRDENFRPKNGGVNEAGAYLNSKTNWIPGIIEPIKKESIFLPIVILFVCLILIGLLFKKNSFFYSLSFQTTSLLFLLKCGFGFAILYVYTFYYPNRETAEIFKHFDDARQVYLNLFPSHKADYFSYIFGFQNDNAATKNMILTLHHAKDGTDLLLIKIHCFIQLFSFGFYPIHLLVFSFISFLGSILLFKVFFHFFNQNKRELWIGLFCIPSILFWTSGTIEDSLLYFFIGLLSYSLVQFHLHKKIVLNIFMLILSLTVFAIFRPYILLAIIPVLIYLLLSIFIKKYSFILILILNLGFLLLLFTVHHFLPSITLLSKITYLQQDLLNVATEMHAHSKISVYPLNETIVSFLKALPSALWNVFISPIPNSTSTLLIYGQFIENVAIILLISIGIFKFNYLQKDQQKIIWLALFFCLFISLFIGWTIPIAGLISRYKVLALAVMIPLIVVVVFSKRKIN